MAAEQTAQNNDWFQAQQQYWDAWFQGQRQFFEQQAGNPAAGLNAQWETFLREWQNLTAANNVPGAEQYRAAFTQAGKSFLDLMQQFCQAGACQAPEEAVKTWTENLQKFWGGILQQNTQPFDAYTQFKSFTDTFTSAGPAFWGDLFKNPVPGQSHPHNAAGFLFDPFGFYASMPGVGYTREKQEDLNALYRLWVDYEGQMRRYNIEMTKVGLQALQQFQTYLMTPPPEGTKPLESLKDIYIKFVDIAEDVYAEFALSEEYTQLYGDVVNALTSYKKQLHTFVDDMLEQMNLPNRQEIDSVHKRVHELRRENLQLRKDIEALKAAVGLKDKPKAAAPKTAAKAAPTPIRKTAVETPPAKKAKAAKTKTTAKKSTAKKAGKK